jgi:aminoglycoside phosphotransferase family enzyme
MRTSSSVQDNKPDAGEGYNYTISNTIISASAFVCIATHTQNGVEQTVVLKVLREYRDKRYHYGTPKKRLTCQKEAFYKNIKITPDIYQGLGRIVHPTLQELEDKGSKEELKSIRLGNIVRKSEEIKLLSKQDGEYALVMSYLPEKRRLDYLLQEESVEKQKGLLRLLATRIEQMHKGFQPPAIVEDGYGNIWGSYKQLLRKLNHNLMYFDLIERHEPELYRQYYFLKEELRYFISQQPLREAFKKRQDRYVKQCHGDLKAKNIWIETIKQDDNPLQYVQILDAIDFNESYRNIDVLADLAMLMVDVEANGGEDLEISLREKYLSLTGQGEDENARVVLAYYLLEKAIVCAIVCLIYDRDDKQLGLRFLELAREYAEDLRGKIHALVPEKSLSSVSR